MPVYKAPREDVRFLLRDVLDSGQLSGFPGYEDVSPDLMDQILEEGAKICEEVLFPLNHSGDEEGCTLEQGKVRTPKGFREAYSLFAQGGWCGLSASPEYGGMGMPHLLNTVMQEMISSANMSLGMYPGLSQGAYDALFLHGTEELKNTYLPKLVEGVWSGTMCLTEPQCGTDLGLIRTKADPEQDGSFRITGTKIFISAGEHDLTENIVHLVLARLPDAPEGVKGISLFVVPKFLPEDVGGTINGVTCDSIEHKMGIQASATCVLSFEKSKGWLVGEKHKGLRAMFTMMNAARLGVGMQGLGIAEVAYQNALAYAKDRGQGRALSGAKYPDRPADPILVHPDIRRMLLTMKAQVEGLRALAYWIGLSLDVSERHPDPEKRREAEDLVALLTPIVKAFGTDAGFEIANLGIQIHGGHGYIREVGVEQYARDARIAQIYEGTNGIQALDLVGRKLGQGYGRLLRRFFHPVSRFIEENQSDTELQDLVFPLAKAFAKLQQATAVIAQKGLKNPDEAAAAASDYLRLFAYVALGYLWAVMAKTAQSRQEDSAFHRAKLRTARFYVQKILPAGDAHFKAILAGGTVLFDFEDDAF